MIKYSVLTFIFGNYERLHDVLDVQPNVEYICITDNKNIKSDTWNVIYDEINPDYTPFRKVIEVRYNPFKYVNSDICLIIDGSIQIKRFPIKLFSKFTSDNYDIAVLIHPERYDLIDEINAWEKIRNLPSVNVNACKNLLSNISYDNKYKGLFQVGLMLVKNTNVSNSLFNKILTINNSCALKNDSFRVDQIIFSTIINKYFSKTIKLLPLSSLILHGKYFSFFAHGTNSVYDNEIDLTKQKTDYKYVFNEVAKCYYIDNLTELNDNVTAAICNFNTTTLTNNVIEDLLKFSNVNKIIILDNSDTKKFKLNKKFEKCNIQILDNTTQKYIQFDSLLKTFDLSSLCKTNNYASLKHVMSIYFLLNIVTSKYLLLCDSDIIIKKQLDFIEDNFITISDIEYTNTASENMNTNLGKTRFTPFIQVFNIEMLNNYNIKYFDILRMHGINGGMSYDTGSSFYEDVIAKKLPYKKITNTDYITHLGHKSWEKND